MKISPMPTGNITIYIDYKSPYAYLAVGPALSLENEYDVRLDWLPYVLEIPLYLGSVEARNEHQWRRVRYAYMDARRLANRRGLVVRGPKKIFDSSLASMGLLFAKRQNVFATYNALTFERFWRRELDIEDRSAVKGVLEEAGADTTELFGYFDHEGPRELRAVTEEAHRLGVFGVPMFVLDGELFWGADSLPLLRERLHQTARPGLERESDEHRRASTR
jgi:2-hydroxychromene-2-carboxylate isomerase